MKIAFKDLPIEEQQEIKSILNGNGIALKEVELYKDGNKVVAVLKRTGEPYTLLFDE